MAKRLFKTKQSSISRKGNCYAYSSLWAKNPSTILPNPLPKLVNELPFNEEIEDHQTNITSPSLTQRLPNLYKVDDQNTLIIDIKSKLVNEGDAVVLVYFGSIASHAYAIRKLQDNTYHFFDCNAGIYEITEQELDNFQNYIHPKYKDSAYGCAIEYISADQDFEPGFIQNFVATAWITACVHVAEIVRDIESLLELLINVLTEICAVQNKHIHEMGIYTPRPR